MRDTGGVYFLNNVSKIAYAQVNISLVKTDFVLSSTNETKSPSLKVLFVSRK